MADNILYDIDIDLSKNQLLNARFHNSTTPPTVVSGDTGLHYWNTITKTLDIWDGDTWLSGGTKINLSGSTDRIIIGGSEFNPIIDIANTYVGQTSINTVGTITGGTWNGTIINSQYGGTGLNNSGNTLSILNNSSISGTNTGNETAISIAAIINSVSGDTPLNTDVIPYYKTASGELKKITFQNLNTFLNSAFLPLTGGSLSGALTVTTSSSISIQGTSSSSVGVRGVSTSSSGVAGTSNSYFGGSFGLSGTMTGNNSGIALFAYRNITGTYNITGPVFSIRDFPTTSGQISGSLMEGSVDSTIKFEFNPRFNPTYGGNTAYFLDTTNNLTGTTLLLSVRNAGVEKFSVTNTGGIISSAGIQISDDVDTATYLKAGTVRYRVSGNNSYCDMCMQTGAATWAWQPIFENNW